MCLLLPVTPCVVPLCVSGCCGSCCCPWCFCACCWSLSSSCWCWRCVSGFRAAGTLGGREMVVPRWPSSTPTAMPVAGGKGCSGVQSGLYRTGKADEYNLMIFFLSLQFGVSTFPHRLLIYCIYQCAVTQSVQTWVCSKVIPKSLGNNFIAK